LLLLPSFVVRPSFVHRSFVVALVARTTNCWQPTNRRTDEPTDGRTDGRTDETNERSGDTNAQQQNLSTYLLPTYYFLLSVAFMMTVMTTMMMIVMPAMWVQIHTCMHTTSQYTEGRRWQMHFVRCAVC